MRDQIWLGLAFVFMLIIVPMVMLMTVTVNSTLPMNNVLWIGTPMMTLFGTSLAYWYWKHSSQTVKAKAKG